MKDGGLQTAAGLPESQRFRPVPLVAKVVKEVKKWPADFHWFLLHVCDVSGRLLDDVRYAA